MINAFANALRSIYNNIPVEILEATFRPRDYNVTLDQRIKDVIISGRVLPDCNVNVGKIKRIPLQACESVRILPAQLDVAVVNPTQGVLFRIPPEAREHRDIVGVIDVVYPYAYLSYANGAFGFGQFGNSVSNLAAAALDSHTLSSACITPTPTLMANNMVLLNPANSFLSEWVLLCRLAYDEEFTSLNRSSVQPLTNLILTATKAYIWTTMIIKIDQAVLSGGQELGQFKSIVEDYRSSLEQYDKDLLNFRGSAVFDPAVIPYIVRAML